MSNEITSYPTLYKRDTTGRVRIWRMERQGDRHRVISGLQDGAHTESGWTICEATNVGRSNERDPVAQAEFEVQANYEHQLSREYHETICTIDKPKFFKPMLAHKYEKFEAGFAQPKLDGVRCIARASGLFSREGKPILAVPHVAEALAPLFEADPDLVLDGELYNHDLKEDFNKIISLVRKQKPSEKDLQKSAEMVQYHVYDVASSPLAFGKRTDQVTGLVHTATSTGDKAIQRVPTVLVKSVEEFDKFHGAMIELGYEGSMLRKDAPYEQKRSKTLLKRKDFKDAEFECVRIEEGLGNWAGLAKRVVCRLPDGREFGAGIRGTQARAKELLNETHKQVTVRFFDYTPDGIPRFPVVTAFWADGRDM